MLVEWFGRLELPRAKSLIPLAQNWAFESGFLKAWLGEELAAELFHSHARDTMLLAIMKNDEAAFRGEVLPFNRVGLGALCNRLGIVNTKAHDALADCIAEAQVYRALITNQF